MSTTKVVILVIADCFARLSLIRGSDPIRVKIYGLVFSIIKFVSSTPLISTTCCLTTLNPFDKKNGLAVMLTSANTRFRFKSLAVLKTSFAIRIMSCNDTKIIDAISMGALACCYTRAWNVETDYLRRRCKSGKR